MRYMSWSQRMTVASGRDAARLCSALGAPDIWTGLVCGFTEVCDMEWVDPRRFHARTAIVGVHQRGDKHREITPESRGHKGPEESGKEKKGRVGAALWRLSLRLLCQL